MVVENYKEISILLNDLSTDVNEYQKQERQVNFNEFDKTEASTDIYNNSWWYGFIRLIVSLPYPTDSCRRLVEFLKIYYEEKTSELRILSEFETTYRSNQAVWWYTRPTFLYNLLNQSLRQHNIHMTFLFGFFIQDLSRQLKKEFDAYKSATLIEHHPITHSYRGQIMHIDEVKKLRPTV
ncbi:unnamed protein product [Didymodactylos carnosus]|uniref:Uncharacterized protein n=1 Tax=Didymodactylos carnosus TaxID=1234261 RepID=A0A814R0H0_9BILA|nr:unnamed protein product [Didymodactylos carnosus]CAF3890746.1 unnamed protein product [Didymodactylos carnosus]